MASEHDIIHRQLIPIKDLPTRSVTIYPSRAAVVRDIENIEIKTGCNEITISGLSMHLDQHSLKVEGHGLGAALIADTIVSLVRAEEIGFDCESEDEEDAVMQVSLWSDELKEAVEQARVLEKRHEGVVRKKIAAENLFKNLEINTSSILMEHNGTTQFSEIVNMIMNESEKLSALIEGFEEEICQMKPVLKEARNRRDKLEKKFLRGAEGKEWTRKREELYKARENPSFGYNVQITIEKDSFLESTPSIAAEASTSKRSRPDDDEAPEGATSYLRISYIIGSGVSWDPRYDLRLDTTSATGHLVCRAGFYATTGETWRDAKVTLSNSQSTFGGLGDKAPLLSTWAVGLQRKEDRYKTGGANSSPEEKRPAPSLPPANPRNRAPNVVIPPGPRASQDYQMQLMLLEQSNKKRMMLARQEMDYSAQKSQAAYPNTAQLPSFGGPPPVHAVGSDMFGASDELLDNFDFDSFLNSEETPFFGGEKQPEQQPGQQQQQQQMREASSTAITYGVMAIYELPGTRTIVSSPQLRRHVIAEMKLGSVEFNFHAVPKIRSAVYMSARIPNISSFALLKGPAGLTLDGSFMGSTNIPRCFPGTSFEVGLGVDQSIQVMYAKPVKKAASQGMLVKEQIVTYSRQIRVHSLRPGISRLRVLDQVPVSEDERLRLVILKPKGLRVVGDEVKVVVPKGVVAILARLKMGGEVEWDLELPEGSHVTLDLEYEAKFPMGDEIVGTQAEGWA